ncbi:MAG TPA: glycosyltransferase family 4 protein, partial [Ramlibacter sp.]
MNTGNAGGRRIVFVNRFFYPDHSATSQILGDLAFELAHQGWAVEVVTSRMSYDKADAEMPQHEVVKGVRIHRVWSTRFGRAHLLGRALDYITFYLGAAATLWRRVDHDTVVVAKTDPPLISVLAAPIASLRGARLVNWLQDLFPEVASTLGMQLVQGPILKLLRAVRNISLRNATNVVLGDRMHAIVRAQNVSSDRIHIIHNWADGESIRPVPHDSNPLRDEWQLAGRFVIGYSGNLGRAHEFSTILDAAQLLAEQTDLVFLFVGAGAQLRGVEDQVRQRGLTNVRFQAYQRRELLHLSLGVADAHLVSLNPALEGLI